jgi:hypothetical protein
MSATQTKEVQTTYEQRELVANATQSSDALNRISISEESAINSTIQSLTASEATRENINSGFEKLKTRAAALFGELLHENSIKSEDLKQENLEKTLKDLSSGEIRTKTHLLRHELHFINQLQRVALNPKLSSNWLEFKNSFYKEQRPVQLATQIAMANFSQAKSKSSELIKPEEKSTVESLKKAFAKQHPLTKGLLLLGGAFGAYKILDWITSPFRAAVKAPQAKAQPQDVASTTQPKGFFSRFWSGLKTTIWMMTGTFIAGRLLDKTQVYGFLGKYLESKGIKVEENRLTKALILFSEFKFLEALMVLLKGTNKNTALHKEMARTLDLRGDNVNYLWFLNDVKWSDFQNPRKKSYLIEAMGSLGFLIKYVPGFSSFFANEKLVKKEDEIRKKIANYLSDLKISVPQNANFGQVLRMIAAKAPLGSLNNMATKKNLTASEIASAKQSVVNSEKQRKETLEKTSDLSNSEHRKLLLKETQKLGGDLDQIKSASKNYYTRIQDALSKFGIDIFPPSFRNNYENADLAKAKEMLLAQIAAQTRKADQEILDKMGKEIIEMQIELEKPNPDLQKVAQLRLKIFGDGSQGGYFSLIKSALDRANNEVTSKYRDQLVKREGGVKETLEIGGSLFGLYWHLGEEKLGSTANLIVKIGGAVVGYKLLKSLLNPKAAWFVTKWTWILSTHAVAHSLNFGANTLLRTRALLSRGAAKAILKNQLKKRIAAGGAALLVPVVQKVVGVGLVLYSGYEAYSIYRSISKAWKFEAAYNKRKNSTISSKEFVNKTQAQDFLTRAKAVHPDLNLQTPEEALVKLKPEQFAVVTKEFSDLPIKVKRFNQSGYEIASFAHGQETGLSIYDDKGALQVGMSEKDFELMNNQAPKNASFEKYGIEYKKANFESEFHFHYSLALAKLRSAMNWRSMDWEIKSANEIVIKRPSGQLGKVVRQSDNTWRIEGISWPNGVNLDLFQAAALLNLGNANFDKLRKATKLERPFEFDGSGIKVRGTGYIKDTNLFSAKAYTFYTQTLGFVPQNLADLLNEIYQKPAKIQGKKPRRMDVKENV